MSLVLDLINASRRLNSLSKLREHQLVEWETLVYLNTQPKGAMPRDVAKAVIREATSFTPIIDRLEKRGLLIRKEHESDRRAKRLFITEEGRAWLKTAKNPDAALNEILKPAEIEQLQSLLSMIPAAEQS